MRSKIQDIASFAASRGISFYLVIYPHAAQIEYPSSRLSWERYSKEVCLSISGCILINAFPEFRSLALNQKQPSYVSFYYDDFIPGDVHFNANGYSVISDLISNAIR